MDLPSHGGGATDELLQGGVHEPDQSCLAEELLGRLIPALIRSGDVAEATILELADQLDAEARLESVEREAALTGMATALRMWAIEAVGPTGSEWRAERARKRLRLLDPTVQRPPQP